MGKFLLSGLLLNNVLDKIDLELRIMEEIYNMESRSKKKQFAINVVTGWLGQTVTMIVGIVQLPYVLWRLGTEVFGVFQLANSALAFFLFLQLGMQPTLVRFLSISIADKNNPEILRVSNTALCVLSALGLLGAATIALLSPVFISFYNVPDLIHFQTFGLLYCLAAAFFVNFLVIVPSSLLMATQRYDIINTANIIVPLLRIGLIVVSFEIIGPSVFILGLVIFSTQLLRLVMIQYMAARQFGWESILSFSSARFSIFKKIYKFSFLTFLHTIFNSLVQQGPVLMIGKLLGLEAAGFYAPAQVVANTIASFMYQTVWPLIPLASQARVEKNFKKIGVWSIHICQIIVSMGLLIALPFCVAGQEITTIWLGEEQAFLWSIIAVAAVGSGIARGSSANGSLALGGGDIVPTTISMGVLALVLPLGIFMLYDFGFGELLFIVIFVSLMDVIRTVFYISYAYSKQFLYRSWDYIYRGFLKPILAFGATLTIVWCGIWYLLPPRNEWNYLGILGLIVVGCGMYVVLLWVTAMECKNKELMRGYVLKFIARVSKAKRQAKQ